MSQQQPHLVRNTSNTPLGLSAGVPFTPGFQSRSDEDDGPPYVFDILPFSAGYMAAATDSRLKYLDRTSLKTIRTFETARSASENDRLTHISGRRSSSSTDLEGQEMLLASYANGCVNLFDMRSASSPTSFDPQIRLKGPNAAPCLCAVAGSSGIYVASGTELYQHEATIRIHDLRSPGKPLHIYTDAHSDDVSTLSFHPSVDHLLLSGSVDGLSSTIDVRIADEDDAILHTANVGASLSRVGWTNLPDKSRAGETGWQGTYALTNMETLSIYDAGDEMSLVREYGDLRDVKCPDWETHYVIDCRGTDDGLAIFAGQREGGLAIMQARHNEDTWSLEQVLYQDGGHTDIVRACHLDLSAGTVASCGEDGRVCLWSLSSSPSAPSSLSSSTANSSTAQLKAESEQRSKAARYAPY